MRFAVAVNEISPRVGSDIQGFREAERSPVLFSVEFGELESEHCKVLTFGLLSVDFVGFRVDNGLELVNGL